jgi:hypothetical protein
MTYLLGDMTCFTSCLLRILEVLLVLEYRNADCRLHHIHEHDVTSSLKGKREKKRPFRREKEKRPLDLFSSGLFLLEEYIKNNEDNVDHSEQSCQLGNPPSPWY